MRPVRLVGILALVAGVVATAKIVPAMFRARRPLDLAFALAAPVTVLLAIAGLVTIVSPRFLVD